MTKVNAAGQLLTTIFNNGDRDECSSKHIINGLCLIKINSDPTNQVLYADYQDAGYSAKEWSKYEEDNSYEPKRTFASDAWRELTLVVQSMDAEEGAIFWSLAYPYGDIMNDLWMEYYLKE